MVKKNVDPPKHIKEALEQTIKQRYPELSEKRPFLTYEKQNEKLTANALFYEKGFNPINASFEYDYDRTTREHYWYCTHDWKD
jgi:hypothetical protein